MLEKLHKTKESEDLSSARKIFCNQMLGLQDYGLYFYHGRQNKKLDSEALLFAIHASGIYFFENSENVFKPAKQLQFYSWKNIKEIQYNSNRLQFLLHDNAAARVKIYMSDNKARHISDLTEVHHKQYLLRQMSHGPNNKSCSKQETFRDFCRKVKKYTMETTAAGDIYDPFCKIFSARQYS